MTTLLLRKKYKKLRLHDIDSKILSNYVVVGPAPPAAGLASGGACGGHPAGGRCSSALRAEEQVSG